MHYKRVKHVKYEISNIYIVKLSRSEKTIKKTEQILKC